MHRTQCLCWTMYTHKHNLWWDGVEYYTVYVCQAPMYDLSHISSYEKRFLVRVT